MSIYSFCLNSEYANSGMAESEVVGLRITVTTLSKGARGGWPLGPRPTTTRVINYDYNI